MSDIAGVLVCKEAPWTSDALAPVSLLQATDVTLSHNKYIKVEVECLCRCACRNSWLVQGLTPPVELWHETDDDAMHWYITLWCSRIMSRVAAHLAALDQEQVHLNSNPETETASI